MLDLPPDPAAHVSKERKEEAFEWLREKSIESEKRTMETENAAIMMYEVSRLRQLLEKAKPLLEQILEMDSKAHRLLEEINE